MYHPQVAQPKGKEPHWWTRRRFSGKDPDDYIDYFAPAADKIKKHPGMITIDGSASTVYDSHMLFSSLKDIRIPDPDKLMP